MAAKKTVVIVLAVVGVLAIGAIGLCVGGVGLAFYLTRDLAAATEKYFDAVKAGDMQGAYDQMASTYKGAKTKEQMVDELTAAGLTEPLSVTMPVRTSNNDRGDVVAVIGTRSGAAVTAEVSLLKEAGVWRVDGFKVTDAARPGGAGAPTTVPGTTPGTAPAPTPATPPATTTPAGGATPPTGTP
jgi:hypothetical protein